MKRKLINSFIILSGSTLITKLFSIFNRMLLARLLNEEAMALYILVIPTLGLCITLAQLSIPSAVFRLISNPKYSNKKVIISACIICSLTCSIIILFLLFFSKSISIYFLKEENAYLPLLSLIPLIPLVGISGIVKNYYLGKEDVWHISVASFLEECARILFTYIMLKIFHNLSMKYLVSIAMIAMSIGEIASISYLLFRKHLTSYSFSYQLKDNFIYKDLMNIALPLTGSRLLHSLYNFIEPIVLVYILTNMNINENTIHLDYAVINGYVINMLVTPTFFNNVILRLLIPILNRDISYNHKKDLQKHIIYGVLSSFIISLPFTLLFYFFGDICLKIMYNTTNGYIYLKYMSIPFTLFYLQTPLSATLQALNKNKELFMMNILECIIEFILLIVLTPIFKVFSVCIVMLVGLLTTLLLSSIHIYQYVYKS
jgi:O-antigen/teichoic acid export membrane protein